MGLQEKLDEMAKQSAASIPAQALEIMGRATDDLRNSRILDTVLKPGDIAPEFTLPDTTGKMIRSTELNEKGPVVISFYRGVW